MVFLGTAFFFGGIGAQEEKRRPIKKSRLTNKFMNILSIFRRLNSRPSFPIEICHRYFIRENLLVKNFFFIMVIFLFFTEKTMAISFIEVGTIKGKVTFNKGGLQEGKKIEKDGHIEVGQRSFIEIKVPEWNAQLTLGPGAYLSLDFRPKTLKKVFLKRGSLRWTSTLPLGNKAILKKSKKGFLFTSQAKLMIKGTDFIVKVGSYFKETEVVLLKGKILFQSLSDTDDYVFLKSPHWVGIGGRFTSSIGEALKLDNQIKNYYGLLLRFK